MDQKAETSMLLIERLVLRQFENRVLAWRPEERVGR